MRRKLMIALLLVVALASACATRAVADGPSFVRLEPLPAPKIAAAAAAFLGGGFEATNLIDGVVHTEYASQGKGTDTFVEFDFGVPVPIGAFRHVDRNDPAMVAASQLTFFDATGSPVLTTAVRHAGRRAGVTMFVLPKAVTARRVRWQVTKMVNDWANCVGGEEIAFFKTGAAASAPRGIGLDVSMAVVVERNEGRLVQSLSIVLDYPYTTPIDVVLRVAGQAPRPTRLTFGTQTVAFTVPAVEDKRLLKVAVEYAGQTVAERTATLKPPRKWVVYLLPHSHVDIGYTHTQPEVMRRQWDNIDKALALCAKTASYPPEAQFKWNAEVLWAMDSYLREAPAEKQQRLVDAIRSGQVELDALYGNELTGLCRPEELLRLMERAMTIGRRCGVKVDSAMISDVPGYTWGIVPAMAQAGVKYFSIGPNWNDRMGRTMSTWEDKPFYWLSPDGQHKVLCWVPFLGYAFGHMHKADMAKVLAEHLAQLEKQGYPYDMVELRWNVGGDNGPPDADVSDMVKNWNATHASPQFVITTTSRLFSAFEKRYAGKIPVVRGDFTPYWEDGAGSSAQETAINRTAAERLVQAEALYSVRKPRQYPAVEFSDAWRNVILYDEHTWGAFNSVTDPDKPFVQEQWKIKQGFALDGDRQSRKLLSTALAEPTDGQTAAAVDVWNTSAWPRTDLVVLNKDLSAAGDVVSGPDGRPLPSQRLSTGELVFLAKDVHALAGRRYMIRAGKAPATGGAKAEANHVSSPAVALHVDPTSGAIVSVQSTVAGELCDAQSGVGLNRYYYVLADKVKDAQQAGPAKVSVKESGPLVASLLVESAAPGCVKFDREIRVIDGLNRVDIINVLDKKAVREKEGVHLGFAFNVPGGVMRMDIPWAVIRPEIDQMPSACREWISVGRWVDDRIRSAA